MAEQEYVKLNSSNVDSVGYDKDSRSLTVVFKNGTAYTYGDVAPQTYAAMLRAPSPGKFVHSVLYKHAVLEVRTAGTVHTNLKHKRKR